jgi:hypothetical protein
MIKVGDIISCDRYPNEGFVVLEIKNFSAAYSRGYEMMYLYKIQNCETGIIMQLTQTVEDESNDDIDYILESYRKDKYAHTLWTSMGNKESE